MSGKSMPAGEAFPARIHLHRVRGRTGHRYRFSSLQDDPRTGNRTQSASGFVLKHCATSAVVIS